MTTRRPLRERFLAKVDIRGENECWPWLGWLDDKGYGHITIGPRGKQKKLKAHRVAYEVFVGPIPEGLTVDHVCHSNDDSCEGGTTCPHRRCVNPAHLEPVTNLENVRRGKGVSARHGRRDRCLHGHLYTPENTRITPQGWRDCRTCGRDRQRQRREAA